MQIEDNNKNTKVISVNISTQKGTTKYPVQEITINMQGVIGDAHSGEGYRQVSMLAQERIDYFGKKNKRKIKPGEFAENITTCGIDLTAAALLDRFKIGDVELEVTQIGKECYGGNCAIFKEIGNCLMPKEGIFCRVLKTGSIKAGDLITHLPFTLRFLIITLSDRASKKEYKDLSGPRIQELLNNFFLNKHWNISIEYLLLPDDESLLKQAIQSANKNGTDIIITSGGTGIGPRDITPDVVISLCDKTIPGIMEYIRFKYGSIHPNALLSRSVVGIMGKTIIYTLPGSLKAVNEYMDEILKTLEHLILMQNGLGH